VGFEGIRACAWGGGGGVGGLFFNLVFFLFFELDGAARYVFVNGAANLPFRSLEWPVSEHITSASVSLCYRQDEH